MLVGGIVDCVVFGGFVDLLVLVVDCSVGLVDCVGFVDEFGGFVLDFVGLVVGFVGFVGLVVGFVGDVCFVVGLEGAVVFCEVLVGVFGDGFVVLTVGLLLEVEIPGLEDVVGVIIQANLLSSSNSWRKDDMTHNSIIFLLTFRP